MISSDREVCPKNGLDFPHKHSHEIKIKEVLNVLDGVSSSKQRVLVLLLELMTTIHFFAHNEIVKFEGVKWPEI